MEHLWSPAGATGGNRWQIGRARKPLKQADRQPVATHGNRFAAHGKEGSTVRVRQRASQKGSKWPVFVASIAYAHRSSVPQPDCRAHAMLGIDPFLRLDETLDPTRRPL